MLFNSRFQATIIKFIIHNKDLPTVTDHGEAVPRGDELPRSISYIPYGEIFVEESDNEGVMPYFFNAKELDDETGLYYYGARYLDPTGAMWLSVDPMWEKNIGASPYNYCHGNPITNVDPDGRDEYEVNPQGYLTKVRETQSHTLYAIDEKGNRTNMKLKIHDKTVVEDLMRRRDDYKGTNAKEGNSKNGNYAFSKNSETLKLFVFLCDVSSESEWSIQKYKDGNYGIFTTHQPDAVTEYKGNYKLTDIVFDIHSHPGYGGEGTKGASGYGISGYIKHDRKYINDKLTNWRRIFLQGDKRRSQFPLFFVYHRKSQTLYQYTPWIGDINLGEVVNYNILENVKRHQPSLKYK